VNVVGENLLAIIPGGPKK